MEASDELLDVLVLCDRLVHLEFELRELPQPNLPPELLPEMWDGRT
jgi:DNA-binding transcriptional regulator PaaX